MAPIHDRMPVLLDAEHWDRWLDPENQDTAGLAELLVPYPADRMAERAVSTRVNDARHEGPDNQLPYEAP
jgi:putative SOS response-associated peptidase YedK